MPVLVNLLRRYALAAVVLPLAAKALGAAGRHLETTRGPGALPRLLQGGSQMIDRRRSPARARGHQS